MNLDGGAFNLGLQRSYGQTTDRQTEQTQRPEEVEVSQGSEQGKILTRCCC